MENTQIPQVQTMGRTRQEVSVIVQEELEIAGVTEATFVALKEKATKLASIGINNPSDLAAVQRVITEGNRLCSTISTAIEPGKKWAYSLHKAYTSNENEFLGTVKAIIDPLKAIKEAYNAEQERIEAEKREAQERAIRERLVAIEGFGFSRRTGMPGADDYCTNGHTTVPIPTITGCDDTEWGNLIRGIEMAWQEEQDRAAAEAERVRLEQEAQAARERALAEERAELDRKAKAINDAILTIRKNELLAMGCVETEGPPGYKYMNVVFDGNGVLQTLWTLSTDVLANYEDQSWQRVIADVKEKLEEVKALNEKQAQVIAEINRQEEAERIRAGELQDIGAELLEYPALPLHQYDEEKWKEETEAVKRRVSERVERRLKQEEEEAEAIRQAYAKRMEQEAEERAAQEADRKKRLSDVERWDEWMQAIENSAPTLVSAQGQHAVARVLKHVREISIH